MLDDIEYDEPTLRLLATNLEDPDVLEVFGLVCKFVDKGGFTKTMLINYGTKRRRYDNAFLILESTKFIKKMETGRSSHYFPTIRGKRLAEFLINKANLPIENFKKLTDEEYEQYISQLKRK
ncbi:hypothetical protein ERICIV_04596 (plasmid) [Paenibacillus larvae subsp. larvae]|uniref:Transcriptional regulator n=1 Tax=Paenibacillus larvae subsp. larvae TaxID=147375 RepID=A0A2L1UKA1_9BACL|nr:hypothetical protein [Paenibacillus larvae]AQT86990.1 hypothetical protein B1222_23440 [Paenibacillus larvae subsp. pulvifaciens]AQZ49322.1 hypothetical protein B5S25_22745 [Paenibacillus larvae subsp. pulvifaciens]AVF28978.1 hypothetical protein ERICIII_04977 [Paenibacillus larvae subsp. larvae]AVF33359.1 hypothetical protein ERICIV_04596 [Paenibacillus larvae subsp. larvae]MCY7518888.1 hypothetical protein [Paenibacillus larvae]